jgi:acyl carrier protein
MTEAVDQVVFTVLRRYVKLDSNVDQHPLEANINVRLDELGLDSLDRLEAVMLIEESLTCEIPEGDLKQCETVSDLIRVVRRSCRP